MLNQCSFIGRLGGEPETRYMPSGDAVTNISLACSESWKDKQTGEKKEHTEWVKGSAFGKLAEIISQYCSKGDLLYISGKMQTRKYQAQDGSDRYATDIKINEMKMLTPKGDSAPKPASQPPAQTSPPDDFDDSAIPF